MEKKYGRFGKVKSEYDFSSVMSLGTQLKGHSGEWLIIIDGNVVFRGKDVKELLEKANKEYPNKVPYLMKVPSDAVCSYERTFLQTIRMS